MFLSRVSRTFGPATVQRTGKLGRVLLDGSRGFVRSLSTKQYWEPKDVIVEFPEDRIKVILANHSHIPLLMPLTNEFLREETIGKAVNLVPKDSWTWPYLYNCTSYPFSVFAVDESGKPVAFYMNSALFRNPDDDPRIRAEYPKLSADDPLNVIEKMTDYTVKTVFEYNTEADKLVYAAAGYTVEEYRAKKLGGRLSATALPLVAKNFLQMGFPGMCSFLTSRKSQANGMRMPGVILGDIPDELYVKPDGTPFRPYYNDPNAMINYVPFDAYLNGKN